MIVYQDRLKVGIYKNYIPKRDNRYLLRLIGINFVIDKGVSTEPVYQALLTIDTFKGGVLVTIPSKERMLVVTLRWRWPPIEYAFTGLQLEDDVSDVGN